MGCSNARLLVQTPLNETNTPANLNANNPINPNEPTPTAATSSDTNNSSTRMHLTGVDLVVERNGSYTLLLTPRTHKQLMPYVLRKKRFRILVDKPRSEGTPTTVNPQLTSYDLNNSERIMESGKELKLAGKKGKKNKQKVESTIESVQQAATDELDKAKARFIGGRSIDRGDPEDIDDNIQSDDEGMIEEIVTTVEEDKDLECKVKKKIETKKTIAQDPETHNKITKVVKTEVTEITRTITINDQHDLERAKRELGIDDVNKLLPSNQTIYNLPSTWVDHPRLTQVQEKYYEPANEIVTSGDFPSDSPIKQYSPTKDLIESEQQQPLADATTVGRGAVVETISTPSNAPQTSSSPQQPSTATDEQKSAETKKKKKKSSLNLCSCTRSSTNDFDDEQRKQKAATIEQKSKQKKKASVTTANAVLTSTNLQSEPVNNQPLISNEIKQLINKKKSLLIEYIHSKIFSPAKLFTTKDQDSKARKVSSRILELLRNDRCSSWTNLFDQVKNDYPEQLPANLFIQPMVKTYEELFTTKQSNLLNTFETIHNEKDLKNISENSDYVTIVQTYINERDNQENIGVITKPVVENIDDSLQRLQQNGQTDEKVIVDDHEKQQPLISTKEIDMTDDIDKPLPIYNEEQLTKVLSDISPHKPITLAEAIAYQYIDLEDPKLGLTNDTAQRIKNLFRPLSLDDESTLNLIRIKRAGQYLTDFNLGETNCFERFHLSEPFIYQLQQSFEPTLDFNEKQFRSLTDAILNNKEEYSKLQFDIGRTLIPAGDMKESSTNDFSQSDSGYSMTTATYESLASKVKNEFETINEPIVESDKTKSPEEYERPITPENSELQSTATEITEEPRSITTESAVVEEKPVVHLEPRSPIIEPVDVQAEVVEEKPAVHLVPRAPTIEPVDVQAEPAEHKVATHLEPRPATIEPVDVQPEPTPIIIPSTKKEESTVSKVAAAATTNLHGASVDLPEVELVKPGPLPTIPTISITKEKQKKVKKEPITTEKVPKIKKSTGGLCASCFGAKAAEKKKKEATAEAAKAPIEQEKTLEETEKKDEQSPVAVVPTSTVDSSPIPTLSVTTNETVNEQTVQDLSKPDDRLGATIENIVITEEPHYQLPSGEPVPPVPVENEYSLPEVNNTYDVPRSLETPSVENIQIDTEQNLACEVQQSSVTVVVPVEQKIESTITVETMPNVEVKDTTSKGSYTLPAKKSKAEKKKEKQEKKEQEKKEKEAKAQEAKEAKEAKAKEAKEAKEAKAQEAKEAKEAKAQEPKVKEPKEPKVKEPKEPKVKEPKEPKVKEPKAEGERKSGLFSSIFRHSDHKSKAPALDLPAVERDLSPDNEPREPHRHESDPLRIPNTDLPKPDLSLPTYDRPEVDMTSGQTKQSSEFTIPVVDLPAIPNLHLPENEKVSAELNIDPMKVPNVDLPELRLSSDEVETTKLPEIHFKHGETVTKTVEEKVVEEVPTITAGLALSSPVNETADIQIDSEVKVDTTIPELPKLSTDDTDIVVKPELLSTEQKYTISDAQFVQPPELSVTVEKQTTENLESPPKLPDFTFELPSTEPVAIVPKDANISVPSFDDDVASGPSKIVPSIDISTPPVKSLESEVIPPKTDVKKKSSTLALCSCFGSKSNSQQDQTKTIAAPKEKTKKTAASKEKSKPIAAPTADLPEVDMPVPESNISSTLKTKGALHAPTSDLPPVDLTLPETEPVLLPVVHTQEKKKKEPKKPAPKKEKKEKKEKVKSKKGAAPVAPAATEVAEVAAATSPEAVVPVVTTTTVEEVQVEQTNATPVVKAQAEEALLIQPPVVEKQVEEEMPIQPAPVIETQPEETTEVQSAPVIEKQAVEKVKETSTVTKKSPSFEIKAPALNIPSLDLSAPAKSDAYIKHEESVTTQSRSDSGLEAIISSHLQPSSTVSTTQTLEGLNQHPSISSGIGSATLDSITTAKVSTSEKSTELKRENSLLRHDFARKISINDESRAKLIFRQNELKKCLETEISQSIEDFDAKKDQKSLNKILTHGIDLIKDKKVTTYPELKQKLIVEHKNDAFIVDPVVRSLYCTIEKQGLDNIDTPEFPLAIRDMVRLPAKHTFETVSQLNKDVSEEPQQVPKAKPSAASCLTCGRTKSKPKTKPAPAPTTTTTTTTITAPTGLLDERRRLQLNTHRNELGTILRDHIQSSQPPIRKFADHPKEVEKIVRKTLTLVTQPKILSYEQVRNDLKSEYKQAFYLIDPTVDIVRDTFDHCDITQMNEKTNLSILDSNITQAAHLYNQSSNQTNLLSTAEYDLLKSNQLSWVNQYLIDNELKEKKLTRKQTKELSKILNRAFELLSLNLIYTWDEFNAQLRREFPKAHNLCDRSIELIKQAQGDGLLLLQQSPNSVQQDVTSINIINVNGKRRASSLITERARQNLKSNRKKILAAITHLLFEYNKPLYTEHQIETYVNKTLHHLEEQKSGQYQTYNDLKEKLKKDFKHNHEKLCEQIVDVVEQVHATNQFDDLEKAEVQTLMRDRLDGKPLVIKEMYVSLPPRVGAYGASKHDDSSRYLSTSVNGDQTFNSSSSSHRIARGLSWREANERARILFYRGKHPAIHYDEQAAAFDVRMLLETTAGGTQEIPVTDSDVHELLNSCGVQWDGVNIISLVDHSEDVVRAAEQAALKVIREKGLVDLRTPPSTRNTTDDNNEPLSS